MRLRSLYIALVLISALTGALLAACGRPAGPGEGPIVVPTLPILPAPTAPAAPTAGAPTALPTATPAPAPPTATAAPAPPTAAPPTATPPPPVGFMPEVTLSPTSGGPGTVVTVTGARFGAEPVAIRLVRPDGNLTVATVTPDAIGNWQTTITMPEALPNGEPIPGGQIYIFGSVDQFQLNIGAQFEFVPVDIPPPPPPWPGPGWQTLTSGDFSGDGVVETIYIAPSPIVAQDRFGDPGPDASAFTAVELMISQPIGNDEHQIMLRVATFAIVAADGVLAPFSEPTPAGFLIAFDESQSPLLHVLPLTADGRAYAQGVGIKWNAEAGAYRLWGGPMGQ